MKNRIFTLIFSILIFSFFSSSIFAQTENSAEDSPKSSTENLSESSIKTESESSTKIENSKVQKKEAEKTPKQNLFSFSVEPILGMRNGTLYEYVFSKNSKTGQNYTLSLLEWNFRDSFYIGANTNVGIWKFGLEAEYKFIFPGFVGKLSDSDWQQDFGYKTGDTTTKTNFSTHDLNLNHGYNVDAKFKFDINLGKQFLVSPSIGASYEEYHIFAHDGLLFYGNPKDNSSQTSYYAYNDSQNSTIRESEGTVIKYDRHDFYLWIGLDATAKLADDKFFITASFSVAPYNFSIAYDSHILRNLDFLDVCNGSFNAFKAAVKIQYNLSKLFSLNLNFSGVFTSAFHGVEGIKNSSESDYKLAANSDVGAETKYFDIALTGKIKF